MIQLDRITFTFPDGVDSVTAVDDVSLQVYRGSIIGITGPSGSGKSSLLAVASTLITPDSGSVLIGDVDATLLTPAEKAELRRDRLGIVFQQSNLLPALTAREQLVVMGELGGGRRGRRARRATASVPTSCWMPWVFTIRQANGPRSSPAVSASGSTLPGR